jgi:hypothetical protein
MVMQNIIILTQLLKKKLKIKKKLKKKKIERKNKRDKANLKLWNLRKELSSRLFSPQKK